MGNVLRLRNPVLHDAGLAVHRDQVILPPPASTQSIHKMLAPPPPKQTWKSAAKFVLFCVLSCLLGWFAGSLTGCGGASAATKAELSINGADCQKQGDGILNAARTCEEAVEGLNRLVDNSPECKVSYKKRDVARTCADVGVQPGGGK